VPGSRINIPQEQGDPFIPPGTGFYDSLSIRRLVNLWNFYVGNSITFPIESLAHDSGRTLVCAEYGYPKGSPNTNS
jgi:hypothetical protein